MRYWADGGKTKLDNLLLLCAHHHRLVHEAGWKVEWWSEDRPAFTDPRGQVHVNGRAPEPAPTLPEDPTRALIAQNRLHGTDPDGHTAGARWRTEFDIPRRVYLTALEALGR